MARNVSIEISAHEDFSQTVTTMRNSNQAFNKDLEETQKTMSDFLKKQDALDQMKKKMQVNLDEASNELKKAKKAFADTNSEINRTNLEKAHENYNKVSGDLKNLNTEAKNTQKSIRNLSEEQSRQANKADSSVSKGLNNEDGLLSRLSKAGLTKMVGDSLSGAAGAYISSAFNNETGNAVSSVIGGITNGAALGTAVEPGVGTAVGAAVGAASGAVSAAAKTFTDKDNAFKSSVQEQYNTVKSKETNDLQSGSEIAAQREQDLISFTTLLGGESKAKNFLSSIRDFGSKTPFEYDQLTGLSQTLLNYGYKQSEIIPLLTKIGDTGSATGMNVQDINMVATALGRMHSTNKTTMEYLNMLMDRHIPALDYLSKATGKTKAQVLKMVSKGLIPGATAAKDIADSMGEANKNSMKLQSQTFSGLKSTWEDVQNDLKASLGEGYNEEAKKGIKELTNTLGGKTGESLKEAYKARGKFEGDLQKEQYELEANAYTSVTTGKITGNFSAAHEKELRKLADDYKKQMQKATKGDKKAEQQATQDTVKAGIIAANEYKATDGYQLAQQGDLDLIKSIQGDDALKDEYWNTGYTMGKQFSSGLAKAQSEDLEKGMKPDNMSTWSKLSHWAESSIKKQMGIGIVNSKNTNMGNGIKIGSKSGVLDNKSLKKLQTSVFGPSNATGLFRVPYNNYPAILHEGETVSTAVEARSQKSSGVKIEINGPVTVRKESDIDEIANKLYQKIKLADMITP